MTRQPGSPVLHRIAVLAAAFLLLPALAIAACTASVPPPQPLPETPAAAALPPAAGQGPSAPEMPPATPAQPTAAPLPPAARGGSSVSAMPQSTLAPALPAVAPSVEIRGAASTPATGGSPVPSALDWNATRTGNQNRIDYDLYLLKYDGSGWNTVAATSAGNQCGSASVLPVEQISFTTTTNTYPYYAVYIQRYQAAGCTNNFGHWMQLHTFSGFYTSGTGANYAFWYNNVCNSITIPADGDSAMAVGATFWGEDSNATYTYGLETFSSFGPRNAAGGGAPGAAVNKPDVAAPDGVSTGTDGASNGQAFRIATSTGFFGTSAAAPHVAGAAASVWSLYPSYTVAQVRNYIQDKALYKADGGTCGGSLAAPSDSGSAPSPQGGTQNNRFGWGRLHLYLTPTAVTLAHFRAQGAPLAAPLAAAGATLLGLAVLIRRRRR